MSTIQTKFNRRVWADMLAEEYMQDISVPDNAVVVGILDEGEELPEYYLSKSDEALAELPEVIKGIEHEIDDGGYDFNSKTRDELIRELLKAVDWNNVREILKQGTSGC